MARAICDRNTGVGADGWMLLDERPGIRLFNSDGSEPELSGNGTRCAAALLIRDGAAESPVEIATGAGVKRLVLVARNGNHFEFEMNMGRAVLVEARRTLALSTGPCDVTIVDCGNPQCVAPVESFAFDWPTMGREIERHPLFPNRTNVSFIRRIDEHGIEARFFERGAGVTMSSGTGSTGAAVAAMERKMAKSPLRVETPAGPLAIEQRGGEIFLTGPAVIIADGTFYYE